MGLLGSKNINAWIVKTQRQKENIKSTATDFVRRKAKEVLKTAVKVSPQFSGNLAANWQLELTSTGGTRYLPYAMRSPGFNWRKVTNSAKHKVGDTEALEYNLRYVNDFPLENLKWNSRIKLVNHAPQLELWESGQIAPRPENALASKQIIEHLKMRYKFVQ